MHVLQAIVQRFQRGGSALPICLLTSQVMMPLAHACSLDACAHPWTLFVIEAAS